MTNEIISNNKANKTVMSSIDISQLVESRHDSVKRTVERLVNQGVIELPPLVEIKTATKPTMAYEFSGDKGKRDSFVVVAQLSPIFTARVVDRWQELEALNSIKALPDFNNPIEAARAWADELEAKTKALESIKVKDELLLAVADLNIRAGDVSISQFAKNLAIKDLGQNNMFRWLRARGFLRSDNSPYQPYVNRGYFNQKPYEEKVKGEVIYKTMITPRGQAWVTKMIKAEFELGGAA